MKLFLGAIFLRWALWLTGCGTQEERDTFLLAWAMAIKVVHENPEAKEALKKEAGWKE